jgi:hypothetical protein
MNEIVSEQQIIESGLLPLGEDIKALEELRDAMVDVYKHGQVFRTRTEMEASVLNDIKHPTHDSKYWQAVREQGVMFSELMSLSFEYRKTVVQLAKAEHELATWHGNKFDRDLLEIEADRLRWSLRNQERTAHHRIRELREWEDIKNGLRLRFSSEDVNEHQLISYALAWMNEVAVGSLETGSAPERVNLAAKLGSVLSLCKKHDCLDAVLADTAPGVLVRLLKYGIGTRECHNAIASHLQAIEKLQEGDRGKSEA